MLFTILGLSVADHLVPYNADSPDSGGAEAKRLIERGGGFDPTAGIIAIVRTPDGVRGSTARRRVRHVARLMSDRPEVGRVTTFYDTRSPTMVARDGRATYIVANFKPVSDQVKQDTADVVKEQLAGERWVRLGGIDTAQSEINAISSEDLERGEVIAFPLLLLLALWFFRGLVAALMPLLVGVVTVLLTFGALRLLAEATEISIYALNLVTALSLGLAIDYSLFIVARYREERARAEPLDEALRRTLSSAGRTVLFSSVTVAGALASLLLFSENFLYSMGVAGAIVPLIAAFVALVVLPAVLVVLGDRIDALAPRRLQRQATKETTAIRSGAWYRLSRFVMRHPIKIATASTTVLLLLAVPALDTKFILADARLLPEEAGSRQVFDTLRERFPPNPSGAIFVSVESASPQDARSLARRIDSLPGVADVHGPQQVGRRVGIIDVVPNGDALSESSKRLVRRIRELPSPAEFEVGGEAARFLDQQSSLSGRLPYALAAVLAVTLLVIFLMTGSLVLPAKSFVMTFLTLGATFGILVFVFQEGRLEDLLAYVSPGALDSTQPILMCALVFGLSTDYGVFLLSRIKEAHDSGHGNREAVAIGLERTGRIVTAAALMFCVAMIVLTTSRLVFIKEIGLGTALAVLIDATIVRAFLVPALMELLGRRNWWAPRPLRRLHARIGLGDHVPPAPARDFGGPSVLE